MIQQWMCYFLNIIIFIVIQLYSIEIFFQQILPELKSTATSKTPLPHCICICRTVAGPHHLSLYFSKLQKAWGGKFADTGFLQDHLSFQSYLCGTRIYYMQILYFSSRSQEQVPLFFQLQISSVHTTQKCYFKSSDREEKIRINYLRKKKHERKLQRKNELQILYLRLSKILYLVAGKQNCPSL